MLTFQLKSFLELTTNELYEMLQLRSAVFVVEQQCVYQDIDGKDKKAMHLLGYHEKKLVAYARIFAPGDYFAWASIGRVVVTERERGNNYGHQLMEAANKAIWNCFKTHNIQLSAQLYLEKFYNSHGYSRYGEGYLEDGIPHIAMRKE